jgi:hypothetical protein
MIRNKEERRGMLRKKAKLQGHIEIRQKVLMERQQEKYRKARTSWKIRKRNK